MNQKKNQPRYSEAKQTALADIREYLKKEGKVFIAFNPKITININIIIAEYGENS